MSLYVLIYHLGKHTEYTRLHARQIQETNAKLKLVIDTIENREMLITLVAIHSRLEQSAIELIKTADDTDRAVENLLRTISYF